MLGSLKRSSSHLVLIFFRGIQNCAANRDRFRQTLGVRLSRGSRLETVDMGFGSGGFGAMTMLVGLFVIILYAPFPQGPFIVLLLLFALCLKMQVIIARRARISLDCEYDDASANHRTVAPEYLRSDQPQQRPRHAGSSNNNSAINTDDGRGLPELHCMLLNRYATS